MRFITLILSLGLTAGASAGTLTLDSKYRWSESFEGFGSYSALLLNDDGSGFHAFADKGDWVAGRFEREAGKIIGVTLTGQGPILDTRGNPITRYDVDAEGVTQTPDGRIHISFEANHRIWSYTDLTKPATPLPSHPDFAGLQNNSGLEALASDADGTIYAIPERSGALETPYPVYRYRLRQWDQPYTLPRLGAHLVTGADFGPDGRLYLLERDFRLLGFATRIRAFTLGPDGFGEGEILLDTRLGELDNMETIEVWEDSEGRTRITLLSDDNNSFLQSTLFAEYILSE